MVARSKVIATILTVMALFEISMAERHQQLVVVVNPMYCCIMYDHENRTCDRQNTGKRQMILNIPLKNVNVLAPRATKEKVQRFAKHIKNEVSECVNRYAIQSN